MTLNIRFSLQFNYFCIHYIGITKFTIRNYFKFSSFHNTEKYIRSNLSSSISECSMTYKYSRIFLISIFLKHFCLKSFTITKSSSSSNFFTINSTSYFIFSNIINRFCRYSINCNFTCFSNLNCLRFINSNTKLISV